MPALALQHSPAGARASAEFFVKTIDWGYATTSGSYMRHYYSATCSFCARLAKGLDDTAKDGNFHVGDRFTEYRSVLRTAPNVYTVSTTVNVSADTVINDKTRKFVSTHAAGRFQFAMSPRWSGGWRVAKMVGYDAGAS